MLSDFTFRLRALFRRSTVEAEMNDELRFHFEQEANKYEKSRLAPEKTLRRARLTFGGMEQMKEECREARGVSLIETAVQDLTYGLRQLRSQLCLYSRGGICARAWYGINTAIFTAYKTMIARPVEALRPKEIVNLSLTHQPGIPTFFSYPCIQL